VTSDSAVITRPHASAGAALVVAYLGAVWLLGHLPALGVSHGALAGALAFSPADLVHLKLWLLPASGLLAAGDTNGQLATLAPVGACVVLLAGAPAFWRAAIAGHVGSTLVAYAIIGVLVLFHPASVRDLLSAPDYGISCVYAGALGGLAVAGARHGRTVALLGLAGAALGMLPLLEPGLVTSAGTLKLATLEHGCAFALGALGVASASPPQPARARARARIATPAQDAA
jgi:hypothetical protein